MSSRSETPIDPKARLEDWKAIADFLGVAERTARNWDREKRLPIHRFADSDKSRVWATVAELQAWSASRDSRNSDAETLDGFQSHPPVVPVPSCASVRLPRELKRWWPALVVLGMVVVASSAVLLRQKPLADFRVQGRNLIALDEKGAEL